MGSLCAAAGAGRRRGSTAGSGCLSSAITSGPGSKCSVAATLRAIDQHDETTLIPPAGIRIAAEVNRALGQ